MINDFEINVNKCTALKQILETYCFYNSPEICFI